MVEIIKFILSDFWVFIGSLIMLVIISEFRLFTININIQKDNSESIISAIMKSTKKQDTEDTDVK